MARHQRLGFRRLVLDLTLDTLEVILSVCETKEFLTTYHSGDRILNKVHVVNIWQ
jgi:hypothetical protein